MMDASDSLLLTNLRLSDGGAPGRRLLIRQGRIAEILPAEAPNPAGPSMDLGDELLLPGLVDGHMLLDKTLFGLPWIPHAAEPFRMSRIENDQKTLPALPLNTAARAGELLRRCVANGTAAVRSHVDITPPSASRRSRACWRPGRRMRMPSRCRSSPSRRPG